LTLLAVNHVTISVSNGSSCVIVDYLRNVDSV
jgi:hypothetical protein